MQQSFLVFDPELVALKEPAPKDPSSDRFVAKTGEPEIKTSHIIPISKDGTVRLGVYRLMPDGTGATTPGFREERDEKVARAEAAAGKLVIRLVTPW